MPIKSSKTQLQSQSTLTTEKSQTTLPSSSAISLTEEQIISNEAIITATDTAEPLAEKAIAQSKEVTETTYQHLDLIDDDMIVDLAQEGETEEEEKEEGNDSSEKPPKRKQNLY